MNWILLGICAITGLTLTSCDSVGNGSSSVTDPTVQQMSDLEKQWGMPDRKVHSHSTGPTDQPIAPEPAPAPSADPAPVATPSPAPAPPSLDSEPPRLDAGTIKKLQ
jgi:hypothetical protein